MASIDNSAGALDDAYAIYANSIQKHVDSLKAAFQDLSQTMISSDVAKFIVDLGTIALTTLQKLQEGLNVFGGILPSIIGIVVGLLARTGAIARLFSTIKGIAESALALRTAFSLMKSGSMAFSVAEILGALSPASIGIIVAAVAALGFALYNLAESSSNGTKSLSDLRNEANDAKQEFEDMQQKVDETKSRIKELQELQEKGLITEAQQEELTLLTSQNELYTQQLELLKRISEYKQGRVKQAEQESAQTAFDDFLRYNDQRMARFDASRADGLSKRAIEANQNGIAGMLNAIEDYTKARDELQTIASEILSTPESDTSKIEKYEQRIVELKEELDGFEDSLNDFYSDLGAMRTNLKDDESRQQVSEWLNQIDDTLGRNNASSLLVARLLGIDWELPSTDVLDRVYYLAGMDEAGWATSKAVLTGLAYVPTMRQSKLSMYNTAWPNLAITYTSMTTQYLATFVNADGSPIIDKRTGEAYTQWVDRGDNPYDPITAGEVDTPIQAATAQYTFTFSGWDGMTDAVLSNVTVTATYTETIRSYTVRWFAQAGSLLETQTANYGDEVTYSNGTPTLSDEESSYVYKVFAGWNKSTGYIREDTDVYAIWDRAELPALGRDLSTMTAGEVYAVASSGRANAYFEAKDHIDVTLGHDFSFTNVESRTLINTETYFDGSTVQNTGITLFGEDDPSFTLAIDFRFNSTTSNNALVSCFVNNGNEGFRLRYRYDIRFKEVPAKA